MPIYEYRCSACQHTFEVFHMAGAEKEQAICPACGDKNPRKLISASATVSHDAPWCGAGSGRCTAGPSGPV